MDTRKRKRVLKPSLSFVNYLHLSFRSLILWVSFLLFLFFLSHNFRVGSGSFRPTRIVPNLSLFASSSISNSIQDLTALHSSSRINSGLILELRIENWVLFTDYVLVTLSANEHHQRSLNLGEKIRCVYQSNGIIKRRKKEKRIVRPVLSADEYHEGKWIVRCPLPPANYSPAVGLKGRRSDVAGFDWVASKPENQTVQLWDMVAYDAVLDGEDTAVVFVKGLSLRSDRESDPNQFSCQFRVGKKGKNAELTTKAITAAQEVIRCPIPQGVRENLMNNEGLQITINKMSPHLHGRSHVRGTLQQPVPSIAKLHKTNSNKGSYKYELCACTMVWNQAAFIKEWITYHAWLGVQRWFIYDNNSNDGLKEVIEELNSEDYNVSRHAWPWVKSQEAGFSHSVIRAREQCSWVAFFDADEFYYFPPQKHRHGNSYLGYPGANSLRAVVENVSSSSPLVAEIRTDCHSFGPSGWKKTPPQGVTAGYTCRLLSPERHKSIVRPDAVDDTLMNHVHHFTLKKEYTHTTLPQNTAVINHYKYQVWDIFKTKFYRRVSTYVADWQENQNEGSRDRAPGLGTEAIEPPNWHRRFCEVWDTGLRDFVLANLADPLTGMLPWEQLDS